MHLSPPPSLMLKPGFWSLALPKTKCKSTRIRKYKSKKSEHKNIKYKSTKIQKYKKKQKYKNTKIQKYQKIKIKKLKNTKIQK